MIIAPGKTVGIIGGGQLGRMSAQAARALGYRVVVADPDPDCPAAGTVDHVLVAELNDPEGMAALADLCDVVTYEFENVNPAVPERLSGRIPVWPRAGVLATCRDRIREKSFLAEAGIPVAPWRAVQTESDFEAALADIGTPSVLKTATEGYDGKGQAVIRRPEEGAAAFARLGGRPLVLEGFVPFALEVSVVVARNPQGEVAAFPVAENIHRENILSVSIAPARVSEATAEAARDLALRIATALDLVGLMGIEMFVLPDGSLLVNELAPRPHNSGHYTMNGCVTSQFEQHIRAVCGLPLGATDLLSPTVMLNLMGEHYPLDHQALLADPRAKLHLYGKREARAKRKMGHINFLGDSVEEALTRAEAVRQSLTRP